MSILNEIHKQPKHVREIMFVFSVVISISVIGMIWFRSFEEDLFVLLNPEPEKQELFYAELEKRTPTIYANFTKALGNLRATVYDSLGFMERVDNREILIEEEFKGEVRKLPLSGDK